MFDPTKDPHYQKLVDRGAERRKAEEAEKRAIAADRRAQDAEQRAIEADHRSIRLEEELRAHRLRSERRDRITLVLAALAFLATVADIILRALGVL